MTTSVSAFNTRASVNICRYSGSLFMAPTLAAGANVFPLNPQSLGTTFSASALSSISSNFNEYRFKKLEFRLWPQASNNVVLAYHPEFMATPPTTIAQASQSPYSIISASASLSQVPVSLILETSVLMSGASKWWKVIQNASADDWDEVQGIINLVSAAATPTLTIELYYEIELTGLANTGAAFSRRSLVDGKSRCIDLFVPDSKTPFPPILSIDKEWIRMKDLAEEEERPAKKEIARLFAL